MVALKKNLKKVYTDSFEILLLKSNQKLEAGIPCYKSERKNKAVTLQLTKSLEKNQNLSDYQQEKAWPTIGSGFQEKVG